MRVVIYARLSDNKTGEQQSVPQQIDGLRRWIEREGWTEAQEPIAEEGSASEYRRTDRARWGEVTDLVASGDIDAVLVWEQSRISRDGMDYEKFRRACIEHGVLLGINGRLHDFTDVEDDFMLGLGSNLSRRESAMISKRVRRHTVAAAKAGRPHGRRQYGYRRIYDDAGRLVETIEDRDTGPVVRDMFADFLAGTSLRSIAIDLNERGVPTRTDKSTEWTASAVRDALTNRSYVGDRVHQGKVVGPAAWPPLVSREDFDETQAMIENRPKPPRGPRVRHLLSGLAACGVCGSPVGILSRKVPTVADPYHRTYQYVCRQQQHTGGGGHTAMAEQHLDRIVTEVMIVRLSEPDFLEAADTADDDTSDQRRQLHEQLDQYRRYLTEVENRAAEELNSELLFSQQRLIQPKIDEVEKKLADLSRIDPTVRSLATSEDIRAAWDALDIEAKRRVIAVVMIPRILPTSPEDRGRRGPNVDRVKVKWK